MGETYNVTAVNLKLKIKNAIAEGEDAEIDVPSQGDLRLGSSAASWQTVQRRKPYVAPRVGIVDIPLVSPQRMDAISEKSAGFAVLAKLKAGDTLIVPLPVAQWFQNHLPEVVRKYVPDGVAICTSAGWEDLVERDADTKRMRSVAALELHMETGEVTEMSPV